MSSLPSSTAQSHGLIRQIPAIPDRIARFSPYLVPCPTAFTEEIATTFQWGCKTYLKTWHVTMDFSLVEPDGRQVNPSDEQIAAIKILFPTCFAVEHAAPFLTLRCTKLPPKPWPVSIAGIPLFLTTDSELFLGIRAYGSELHLEAEIHRWRTPDSQIFIDIFEALRVRGANIESVQWMGWGLLILSEEEPCDDWRKKLPSLINDLYVGYIIGPEAREEKALRRKIPQGNARDDSFYTDHRPGIVLAGSPGYLTPSLQNAEDVSTSGICVEAPNGNKYVTVASHGFPNGVCSQVWHPDGNGTLLGTIEKVFESSDISLCRLEEGINYSRETFANPNAAQGHQAFRDFAGTTAMRIGDLISMDSPFSGRCYGNVIVIAMWALPADDPEAKEVEYLNCFYGYFGNGSDALFDGCCGAAIWNGDYDVVGQFSYQMTNRAGHCFCPSFKILKDAGYRLSKA
ncbi:MAG: hypothetical protein Q9174_004228 [Haloplaca sp. 1 TL-2023]